MNKKLILADLATIDSIVGFLARDSISTIDKWTWNAAVEATYGLMMTDAVAFAHGPEMPGPKGEWFSLLYEELSGPIRVPRPSDYLIRESLRKTKRWVYDNSDNLELGIKELFSLDKCLQWLNWEVYHKWLEHIPTEKGLFDAGLLWQLAKVLDSERKQLKELLQLTKDKNKMRDFIKHHRENDDFLLIEKAYVLSAIIRGVYHDYLAFIQA